MFITFCLIVNKYLSSKEISFSNMIPCLLDQDSLKGVLSVNLLSPVTDQIEFESGILIFLSVVIEASLGMFSRSLSVAL